MPEGEGDGAAREQDQRVELRAPGQDRGDEAGDDPGQQARPGHPKDRKHPGQDQPRANRRKPGLQGRVPVPATVMVLHLRLAVAEQRRGDEQQLAPVMHNSRQFRGHLILLSHHRRYGSRREL